MKKSSFIIFVLLMFYSLINFAQTGIEWQKCYAPKSDNHPYDAIKTSDGNFLIVGAATITTSIPNYWPNNINGYADLGIMLVDSIGNILWKQNYGGNSVEHAKSVYEDKYRKRYYIAGETKSWEGTTNFHRFPNDTAPKSDAWMICIDSVGNLLWERCYGNKEGAQTFRSIIQLGDSNKVYALGQTIGGANSGDVGYVNSDTNANWKEPWLVEIDANNGNFIKSKTYGSSVGAGLFNMASVNNEKILLVGVSYSQGGSVWQHYGGSDDGWLIEVDTSLNISWQKSYGTNTSDAIHDIITNHNKEILLIGRTAANQSDTGTISVRSAGIGDEIIFIIKLDSLKNEIGQYAYGYNESGSKVNSWCKQKLVQTDDKGYIMAVNSYQPLGTNYPVGTAEGFSILKLDSSFNEVFFRKYGRGIDLGGKGSQLSFLIPTSDNGLIIGSGSSPGPFIPCSQDTAIYGEPGQSYFWWVFKLGANMSIGDNDAAKSNIKVYPNPGQDIFNIEIANSYKTANLQVFNSLGQLIFDKQQAGNSQNIKFNLQNHKSGLYLIKLEIDGEIYSMKIILE